MRNKRRRMKKRTANIIKLLFHVLAISLFLVLFGWTIYDIVQEKKKEKEPVSEYVSLTEEASARAYVWLNRIEDMPLSYDDIRKLMGELRLTVVRTPAGEKGTYAQALEEDTYEDCIARAQEGFEKAYRETARHRFSAEGYEEEISDEMLDDMMREAYGVSVAEYLKFCDVQLLPELEELKKLYNVEITDGGKGQ